MNLFFFLQRTRQNRRCATGCVVPASYFGFRQHRLLRSGVFPSPFNMDGSVFADIFAFNYRHTRNLRRLLNFVKCARGALGHG